MSGQNAGKPLVEAVKSVRPGRRARRIVVWAVFACLTACLIAMSAAVALRMAQEASPL